MPADTLTLAVAAGRGVVVDPAGAVVVAPADPPAVAAAVRALEERHHPRWVWWRADVDARPLVDAGVRAARCWDVAEVHRLLVGGATADPGTVWAWAHGLDPDQVPSPAEPDLLAYGAPEPAPDDLVDAAGHLRADAVTLRWQTSDGRLVAWARAATEVAAAQRRAVAAAGERHPGQDPDQAAGAAHRAPGPTAGTPRDPARLLATAWSESAAALLCVELERRGLPVDRPRAEALIETLAGPRPRDEAHAAAVRAARDAEVLRHVPGADRTDLRNPAQVRALLASVGVVVDDTRRWTLEAHRSTHPVVPALLAWRKAERVATTYGWGWLAQHVGADDRLRGGWTACDGGAGRMTAGNGLHSLPVELRPAVAAEPGHVLVRADLGQVEPRVLAAVARDEAFAAATRDDDLYAPVARALGVDRPTAKVAVLAAMYGQTSGSAGRALARLERAYPRAMAYLRRAHDAGVAGVAVTTWGGRLVRMWPGATTERQRAARGRFARNAVVQGAAAELFKAWAATVRAGLGPDAHIVLCLHDELLVHVAEADAPRVVALLHRSLTDAARRWAGTDRVRFVADVAVVHRWSQAKA